MSDFPAPDLKDSSGRMRILVVALLAGGAAAAAAYFIADGLAKPDQMIGSHTSGSVGRATGFVWYVTAFAGAFVFAIALAVQNHFAKKKYMRELQEGPRAKVVR